MRPSSAAVASANGIDALSVAVAIHRQDHLLREYAASSPTLDDGLLADAD